MAYTYDDFQKAASAAGLMGNFSKDDLDMAQRKPEYGLSMLKLYQDEQGATTAEQRLLAQEAMNQLRSSFKAGGEVTAGAGFQYDREQEYRELLDSIVNRDGFSYDHTEDPRWSALKKTYTREGERATADALGQAAAATGGVPSSYAMTAATQAGDYYAGQLSDRVPELYDNAYNRYLSELGLDIDALGAMEQERVFDYNSYLEEYEREQQKVANALGIYQATGQMTPEMAEILGLSGGLPEGTVTGTAGGSGSGSTGSTGGGGNNGSLTPEQVMELQKALGVTPDGVYGPMSQEAAKGLTAEEAYGIYVDGSEDPANRVINDLKDRYPLAVVSNRDEWDALVEEYGEENLAAAGYRFEESGGKDERVWNRQVGGKIIISGKEYTIEEVAAGVENGTIHYEFEPGTGKVRYYTGRQR